VSHDTLTVPLNVANAKALGTVKSLTTVDPSDAVTNFATQVYFKNEAGNDTTITSDYAVMIEEKVSDAVLSHVRYHKSGNKDTDFIQTGMLNNHCGECTLPAHDGYSAYTKKGMHLFKTTAEVIDYITTTKKVDGESAIDTGEGQDLVNYREDIDLNKLVETHYTNTAGQHDVFSGSDFDNNFKYIFELTSIILGDNLTDESAHAALYEKDGHIWLHPQDPDKASNGLKGRAYTPELATEVVVNRVPVVRVSLVYKKDNRVIDYGYIPIRIIKDPIVVSEKEPVFYDGYTSEKDWEVTRYNECYIDGGADFEAYRTTWRETEEHLMSHPALKAEGRDALDRQTFEKYYTAQGATLVNLYQWEVTVDSKGVYHFEPCVGNPDAKTTGAPEAIGTIGYNMEAATNPLGTETSILYWNIKQAQIQDLAERKISSVSRAILLKSSDEYNFPSIYVIFHSGKISLVDVNVEGDAKLKTKIIKQYWYAKNSNVGGSGDDEIHAMVFTPQEKVDPITDVAFDNGIIAGVQAWKPVELQMTFASVFLNNFNLISGKPNTPQTWIDFAYSYKDKEGEVPASLIRNQIFNSSTLQLDFIFDESNNNAEYKGNLKDLKDQVFLMWVNHNEYTIRITDYENNTTTKVFKPGRVLMARKKSKTNSADKVKSDLETDLQLIAYIEPNDTSMVDPNDANIAKQYVVKLNNHVVTAQEDKYAKSLLNYRAHNDLQNDFLNAKVALVAMNQQGANSALSYNTGTAEKPVYKYCKLPLKNNTFDVRFIRPLKLKETTGDTITDAHAGGQGFQKVDVSQFIDVTKDFEDFRGGWKTADPNYVKYYAPNDTTAIAVHVEGVELNDYLSSNHEVLTDINVKDSSYDFTNPDPAKAQPLYQVAQDLDFKLISRNPDVYEYRNNSATVGIFHVWVPVTIEYYWGTIYDRVMITINSTPDNGARRK
jgi:hypothetical protein